MRHETRRTVLVGAGIGIATLVAGCLDESTDSAGGMDDTNETAAPTDGDIDGEDGDGDEDEDEDEDGDGDGDVITEEPRVDEPPYAIERPAVDTEDEPWKTWNDDYLGDGMATDPSVGFESLSRVGLADPALRFTEHEHGGGAYAIRLIETAAELTETIDLDATAEESRTTLEGVTFDEQVVIVVESGFGSGSIAHRWARVEAVDDGLHLHGSQTRPYEQTDDLTTRHSVLVVDRPVEGESIGLARTSLTVSEDRRIQFNSTEGVVLVDG